MAETGARTSVENELIKLEEKLRDETNERKKMTYFWELEALYELHKQEKKRP